MDAAAAAGLWGLLAGSALVLGAAVAWFARIPQRLIAAVMAFGSGVLISALSFDLMDEAYRRGGAFWVSAGFLTGGAIYTAANAMLARWGAKHRKRSDARQPKDESSGVAIALGALLDGVPESLVIGTSLLTQRSASLVAVGAVFLSNVPEGLSSASGMKKAGRSAAYVFGVWGGIAVLSGLAATGGYVLFAGVPAGWIAAIEAVAAGAILAMIADTMIPEATELTHDFTGMITVAGFLAAFTLSKLLN